MLDFRPFALLSPDGLEGIPAFELAHVEGEDHLVRAAAVSAMGIVAGLVLPVFLPVTLLLVAMVLSAFTLTLLAYSRRPEFAADRRAAVLT